MLVALFLYAGPLGGGGVVELNINENPRNAYVSRLPGAFASCMRG